MLYVASCAVSVGRLTNSSINRRSSTFWIFMYCLLPPMPSHLMALLYPRQHLHYLSTMKPSIAAQVMYRRKLNDMLNYWTIRTTGRMVVMRTAVMIMKITRNESKQRKRRKPLMTVNIFLLSLQPTDRLTPTPQLM